MQRGIGRLRAGGGLFNPVALFASGEQGAHFETYDPQSLLRRRNQLTYSSQFSNAAWTQTNLVGVTPKADGVGDLVVPNTSNTVHSVRQSPCSVGVANTVWARVKPGGYGVLVVQSGALYAKFDLASLTVPVSSGVLSYSITAAADAPGYCDCVVVMVPTAATLDLYVAQSTASTSFAGDGVSGVYLARAQLEWNTTTPSAYQEVTDWNTEYLAAAGSANVGMWQDSTGTTPVTAVEQPVGKWIDKSGRGNHATQSGSTKRPMLSARYNTLTSTEQIVSGQNNYSATGYTVTNGAFPCPQGPRYLTKIEALTGNNITAITNTPVPSPVFRVSFYVAMGSRSSLNLLIRNYTTATNVYPTTIQASGSMSGGVWKSEAVGSGIFRVWIDCTAGFSVGDQMYIYFGNTGNVLADGEYWYAGGFDLRTADDAAKNIPAYQRVNTSTDYDTVGFPHYLKFDGADDCLQTGSIDFTAFDKMTVWAGLTKLADAGGAAAVELSAASSSVAGTFAIFAPNVAAPNVLFRSRGSVLSSDATATTYAAPVSLIATGIGSIADDVNQLRIDGSLAASTSNDQGSGNFSNNPMNIGGRNNGTSAVFNGRLTSLTVRGSATPSSQQFVAQMEQYAARLAGLQFTST